jgi:hypothetical protein
MNQFVFCVELENAINGRGVSIIEWFVFGVGLRFCSRSQLPYPKQRDSWISRVTKEEILFLMPVTQGLSNQAMPCCGVQLRSVHRLARA